VTYLECRERIARMGELLNTAASEADAEARRAALRTILQLNPAADLIAHARATGDEALVAPIVRDLADVQPLIIVGLAGEVLAGPPAAALISEARHRIFSHINVLGSLGVCPTNEKRLYERALSCPKTRYLTPRVPSECRPSNEKHITRTDS